MSAFWALLLITGGAVAADAAPLAYVTSFNSYPVSVIDTATDTIVATVPVGDGFGVTIRPDGAFAYAIVTCEHDKLGTFKVPQNLLFLLGLSNAVYIAGKAVAPNSVAELDKKIRALRDAERKWTGKALAVIVGDGKDKWRKAIETAPDEYMEYITAPREAARMLEAIYGEGGTKFKSEPIDNAQLMPEFQPAAGIQSVSPQPAPPATAPVSPTAQTPATASPAAIQKEQPNPSSVSKAA